ncbi:MAG: J domain-containing protein, partial [Pseudomonadota bacterium]|nr:J domain-containing protein [Pseudomonadota bacterium]
DPGAAFYFELDGKAHVLACDRWDQLADNIAAIAAHIEALRGQERWGVADLRQAFAGHVALAAPDPWWIVLGVDQGASIDIVTAVYRAKAKTAHPNAGGERAAWDRLQAAFDTAKMEKA